MDLQPLFIRFDETIKLKRFAENAELREKRDRVLKRLRDNLQITFEPFNQGSYELGLGIKPLNGDYDIDVGIILNGITKQSHPDPLVPKKWVHDAVFRHTANVTWRRNCIRVQFQESREPLYHVDLPVFVRDERITSRLYLAVGERNGNGEWQADGRQGLAEIIVRKNRDGDYEQFRRAIRALKRWKNKNFPSNGWAAPTGHALTIAAYQWFVPKSTSTSTWGQPQKPNDLQALRALVDAMRNNVQQQWTDQGLARRLILKCPVEPFDDVFAKMTNQQMQEFEQRLSTLSQALAEAEIQGSPKRLRDMFSTDFPEG